MSPDAETKPNKRVLIGVPSWGTAPPEACQYREQLMYRLGMWKYGGLNKPCPYDFLTLHQPDLLVQFSRDRICRKAIEEGFDYVAMIDDDMIGPVELWEKLLEDDVDIVAPLAFTRLLPHLPVCYGVRGGWMPNNPFHSIETHVIRNYPKDTLFECDAVGFGAVLIKTSVLKQMPGPWFFTMWGTKGTGEDIWFCLRAAREAGARIFCDARVKLGHLGPRTYIGEADYEKANPEVAEMRSELGTWTHEKSKNNLVA